MNDEMKVMAYMMAAEKMSSLIHMIDQTIIFLEDYKIEPDEEVKKMLNPLLDQLAKWAK